ncbi:parasitic phase-specific protein PSP-1 [Lophiotrema nucula]|uniref:Parasitic phase-specific protein PSP-1 n=1 Tax=Lophiotrema nucula TaxID=690887 RepID=A0A6A5YV33_9PLEO|nr:parasitic phase-specific protein PSP-1 [Lophiotrema nucula]
MPENDGFVHFGPNANCTFELCGVEDSVYGYRMSLPANIIFIILYPTAALVHIFLRFQWRTWWFMWFVLITCLHEVVGYGGRILLYNNPWSFTAFMINIICITQAPVFYCAAIYVSLVQTYISPPFSISHTLSPSNRGVLGLKGEW